MSTLDDPAVAAVLHRLVADGAREDEPGKARVRAREAELSHNVYGLERAELYGTAPISVTREVGRLLYILAASAAPGLIVEFGASVGFSTIHLAAAVRDASGTGTVITTELDPHKTRLAAANLRSAGLADIVDLRAGDARTTLAGLTEPIDFLFLDGWNDLYLDVLALVEPRLRVGAIVVADLSAGDPSCEAYRERMENPTSGYVSQTVPLDDGVVVSVRGPLTP